MFTGLLLSCALATGQGTARAEWQLTPQLTPGLELAYSGTYLDETLVPGAQHQRQYRPDAHLLVLDGGVKDWHVAFTTGLALQDARQALDKKTGPTSPRLEQARVDLQGRVHTLDKKRFDIPINGPATLESGFLLPAPAAKVGRNFTWDLNEPGQPTQRWQVLGTESSAGVQCIKIAGVQHTDDWERPRADQTAWRRRDTIWLHPQFNVAQKVERIVELRAPARDAPTHRHVVVYDLDSSLRFPGRAFEERKDEVLKASKYHEEAQLLLQQPVLNRTLADGLIQRVSFHPEKHPAQQATPYRKAVQQAKTVLEKAEQGDVPAPRVSDDIPGPQTAGVAVGQRVPDFAVSSLTEATAPQLKNFAGKPVLIFFYNPSTQLGEQVLKFAKSLHATHGDQLGLMAMAVAPDGLLVRKQHKEMRLAFPILDGDGLRLTLGAAETPRFILLDGDGIVRLAQTGWGYHTPSEIAEMLERCRKK